MLRQLCAYSYDMGSLRSWVVVMVVQEQETTH